MPASDTHERLTESIRRLIGTSIVLDAPPDVLARAADTVDRLVGELARFVPTTPPARFQSGATAPNDHFPYDIVLGRLSPLAPPVLVEWHDPKIIGRVRFEAPYEGPPGCVHGAVIASAFDQVLSLANLMRGNAGPTVTLEIRYRRPTPLRTELRFEGWQERVEGRRMHTAGRLLAGDTVTVEARAVFAALAPEDVMNMLERRR